MLGLRWHEFSMGRFRRAVLALVRCDGRNALEIWLNESTSSGDPAD
jgi:hypothetical protein